MTIPIDLVRRHYRARRRAMATLGQLASLPRVDSSRLASIGFYIGGNFSLELAREGAPLLGS
jgi:dienelactone hydrolase